MTTPTQVLIDVADLAEAVRIARENAAHIFANKLAAQFQPARKGDA